MSVTPARYEEIKRNHKVLLGNADGQAVLADLLEVYGIFADKGELKLRLENPEQNMRLLVEGLLLLWDLGVLHPSNRKRFIEAIAAMPLPEPDSQENE